MYVLMLICVRSVEYHCIRSSNQNTHLSLVCQGSKLYDLPRPAESPPDGYALLCFTWNESEVVRTIKHKRTLNSTSSVACPRFVSNHGQTENQAINFRKKFFSWLSIAKFCQFVCQISSQRNVILGALQMTV